MNYDPLHERRVIADTIQRVYGDATQTALDHEAARKIWDALLGIGVAPLSFVAALIEAAGGEVIVPFSALVDPPDEVVAYDALDGDGRRFTVRRR